MVVLYRSVSNCVFANLALPGVEEWLYTHVDLTGTAALPERPPLGKWAGLGCMSYVTVP